jgi:hypothetical protein
MVPNDKLLGVAEKLLAKTKANKAIWEFDYSRGYASRDAFIIDIGGSRISVAYFSPNLEPDGVRLSLQDEQGNTLASIEATEGVDGWPTLYALFKEAQRVVTGWDKTLLDIERALDTNDLVGAKKLAQPTVVEAAESSGNNDIPF